VSALPTPTGIKNDTATIPEDYLLSIVLYRVFSRGVHCFEDKWKSGVKWRDLGWEVGMVGGEKNAKGKRRWARTKGKGKRISPSRMTKKGRMTKRGRDDKDRGTISQRGQ
jgi:hypothetical protein